MPKPKSSKWKKIVLLLVVLGAGGGIAYQQLKTKELPINVQKEKVARRNLTEQVEANGKLQPVLQVKISPEVSGEIIEMPYKEGQDVKKGDLLVKIKPDNYLASRDQQKASYEYSITSLNSAQANFDRAQDEFKRNEQLHDQKMVSDSVFQESKTSFIVSKASLAGAKQNVELARAALSRSEDDLSKTTVYSPLDGTITKLNSQLGERVVGTATMAGTEIMTVSDLNTMEARVDINEMDIILIKLNQSAHIEVDSFKDSNFSGVVTYIANSAKSASTSGQESTKFEVRVRVNERSEFRPGMSCSAKIETRSRANVLAVPIQSVTTRMPTNSTASATNKAVSSTNAATSTNAAASTNAASPASSLVATNAVKKKSGDTNKAPEIVFVIDNNVVHARPVHRGISDDNYTEIIDGLKEGDEVVSGGYRAISRELEEGKAITVGAAKGDVEIKK